MIRQTISVIIRAARRDDVPAIATMAAEFHAFLASKDNSDPTFDIERATLKLECGFRSRPLFSALIAEASSDRIGYAIYNIVF